MDASSSSQSIPPSSDKIAQDDETSGSRKRKRESSPPNQEEVRGRAIKVTEELLKLVQDARAAETKELLYLEAGGDMAEYSVDHPVAVQLYEAHLAEVAACEN